MVGASWDPCTDQVLNRTITIASSHQYLVPGRPGIIPPRNLLLWARQPTEEARIEGTLHWRNTKINRCRDDYRIPTFISSYLTA
jgi:hypothetical protein